jgi:hypothetical protein
MPPPPSNWKPLAKEAVDDLFKEYVASQLRTAVQSRSTNPLPIATFLENIKFAVTIRDSAHTAIDTAP